jgi:predicted Zn-ribbon and HTH transcriptional regulator
MRTSARVAKVQVVQDGWQCERCGHQWVPRVTETPSVCPKCKSPYWDRPRRVPKEKP